MPVLRKAALEDYEQILRMKLQVHNLHVNAKPEFYKSVEVPLSFQQYQSDLENGAVAYYVLCANDMVLGYAVTTTRTICGHPVIHDRKILYIEEFCVDEQYRGAGVGTELFRQIEARALSQGCDAIELDVWTFNEPARTFYVKMGMECARIRMHKALDS